MRQRLWRPVLCGVYVQKFARGHECPAGRRRLWRSKRPGRNSKALSVHRRGWSPAITITPGCLQSHPFPPTFGSMSVRVRHYHRPCLSRDGDRPRQSHRRTRYMARVFGLVKHVAHARCAHTNKHFDEIRAGYAEEWHARFARNRFGEQRFTCARGLTSRMPCGMLLPSFGILRVFEKSTISFRFLFGLVTAGNVIKIDALRAVVLQTLSICRPTSRRFTAVHLTHREEPQPNQQ